MTEPKTKAVADFLVSLGQVDKGKNAYSKTLLVVDESDAAKVAALSTAAKNVPNTLLRGVNGGTSLKARVLTLPPLAAAALSLSLSLGDEAQPPAPPLARAVLLRSRSLSPSLSKGARAALGRQDRVLERRARVRERALQARARRGGRRAVSGAAPRRPIPARPARPPAARARGTGPLSNGPRYSVSVAPRVLDNA